MKSMNFPIFIALFILCTFYSTFVSTDQDLNQSSAPTRRTTQQDEVQFKAEKSSPSPTARNNENFNPTTQKLTNDDVEKFKAMKDRITRVNHISENMQVNAKRTEEREQKANQHSTIPEKQDEKPAKSKEAEDHAPQTAQGEMSHGITAGFKPAEKQFYNYYKKKTGGHWLKLRKLRQDQLDKLCEDAARRSYEHEMSYAVLYEGTPLYQKLNVILDIEDIENMKTDLLKCGVQYLIVINGKTYDRDLVFYLAEGNSSGSLFYLKPAEMISTTEVEIVIKIQDIIY